MSKPKKTQVEVSQLRFFHKLLQKASEEIRVELVAQNIPPDDIAYRLDILMLEFNKMWNPELYDMRLKATEHYKAYEFNKAENAPLAMQHLETYKELKVRIEHMKNGI